MAMDIRKPLAKMIGKIPLRKICWQMKRYLVQTPREIQVNFVILRVMDSRKGGAGPKGGARSEAK